ncbi:MAG: anti-sigma factor [Pseudomonadota bacterium]
MSTQERQLDAAEYVIGTMTAVERRAFEVSIEGDEQTRSDVAFWERSFGALNASVAPEPAPADVWARIESALPSQNAVQDGGTDENAVGSGSEAASTAPAGSAAPVPMAANDNALNALRRSRGRWRMGAVAASLVAVAGFFLANEGPVGDAIKARYFQEGNEYIAVVNAAGDQPSLVVSINPDTGNVTVRSVGVERPEGKSLELWYVPEGEKAVSVGLVGEGGIDLKGIPATKGDLLAISLEPQGGSPTGTATGPVIYTGKLVENVPVSEGDTK